MQLPGSVALPPVSSHDFVSQRHEVNPALALNLLNDIQSVVLVWQDQLRQIVAAMHKLHAQGPMVNGWIESSADDVQQPPTSGPDATLLRHGDTDALMQYVEALDTHHPAAFPIGSANRPTTGSSSGSSTSGSSTPSSSTQYRLCSLDEDGRIQSQPCPAEQMGAVSLAIARYQKFKQLLSQKQAIDKKLQKAVDQLTGVRATLHH